MDQPESHNRKKRFVQDLRQLVLENLGNEQFSVEKLAEDYGVSRSQLHKKLKKSTGKSVSQFIREIRLEEAMKLLKHDEATASEIAYQVGFSSPTYFNTSFKDYFGYPPGEVKVRMHLDKAPATINEPLSDVSPMKRRIKILLLTGMLLLIAGLIYVFSGSSSDKIPTSKNIGKEAVSLKEQTIAVLPLKNWSGDPELEYISDGLTDAIIIKLVRIGSIKRVIPFTSMLSYKQTDKSIEEIAKELGVKNILQGSFQLSGNEVNIKVQLIDGPTENHFWEGEFKSNWESNEIFSLQSEVAENVAHNINAVITTSEQESIRQIPTSNKEAYELYLQAEYRFNQLSIKGIEKAQSLYSEAIALDSTFIDPYIGLAISNMLSGLVWGIASEEEAWSTAKPIFLKALEIDKLNSNLYQEQIKNRLYQGLYLYEWEFEPSEMEYVDLRKNSLDDIPYDDERGNFDYARKTGRHEDVLAIANHAITTYLMQSQGYVLKASTLFFLDRWEEAIEFLSKYDKLYSDDYFYLMETAKYYHYLGENEKSKRHLELFKKQFSDRPPIILWLNAIHAEMASNLGEVQKTLKELQELYNQKTSGSPAWFLALYYCHIKDYDRAFEWLYKSYERHEVEMTWLKEEPVLRPLHDDPRYLDLYDKVGFSKIIL